MIVKILVEQLNHEVSKHDSANSCPHLTNSFKNALGVQAPTGFWDPAGFTADGSVENFKRRRQTELKHGRISMLATMGYITPEQLGKTVFFPQLCQTLVVKKVSASTKNYTHSVILMVYCAMPCEAVMKLYYAVSRLGNHVHQFSFYSHIHRFCQLTIYPASNLEKPSKNAFCLNSTTQNRKCYF